MNEPWTRKVWKSLAQYSVMAIVMLIGLLAWGIIQFLGWVTGINPAEQTWIFITPIVVAYGLGLWAIAVWTDHKDAWLKKLHAKVEEHRRERKKDREYPR